MEKQEIILQIAQRLKMIRKIRKLTAINIAQQMGISRKQYHNYESNCCSLSVFRLCQLAEILNVDISYFFDKDTSKSSFLSKQDLEMIYLFKHIKDKTVQNNIFNMIKVVSNNI